LARSSQKMKNPRLQAGASLRPVEWTSRNDFETFAQPDSTVKPTFPLPFASAKPEGSRAPGCTVSRDGKGGAGEGESPWYSPYTGTPQDHFSRELLEIKELQKEWQTVEIYPSGVEFSVPHDGFSALPPGRGNGKITTLSCDAARRLRRALLTLHVPGSSPFAVTLTTHKVVPPEEWRSIMKRFRQSLIRARFPGIWRVELQRRATPHLHVVFWLTSALETASLRELWLRATGETEDAAA